MTSDTTNSTLHSPRISREQLAHLGGGAIAYVRPLTSDDAQRLFPQVGQIPEGLQLFALLNADGTPIVLTDSRQAAIANAWENKLQTVSLH